MKFIKVLCLVAIVFLCFLFISCGDDTSAIKRNQEFEFDHGEGKLFRFTFDRQPEGDTLFMDMKITGKDSIITTTFVREYPITEVKWKTLGNDVEFAGQSIFYPDESGQPKKIKGDIKSVSPIDGKYTGTDINIGYILSLTKKISTITTQKYSGDTTFFWSGQTLPTIKFDLHQNAITINRLLPVSKSEMKFSGATFFAKGLGFVGEYYKSDEPIEGRILSSSLWLIGIERLE